jgi:hypothetical protein
LEETLRGPIREVRASKEIVQVELCREQEWLIVLELSLGPCREHDTPNQGVNSADHTLNATSHPYHIDERATATWRLLNALFFF